MPVIEASSEVKVDDFGQFDMFINTFFLTEAISAVVSEEYSCSIYEGYHLAWLSEPFGIKEYPSFDECVVLRRVQAATSYEELRLLVDKGEDVFMGLPFEPVVSE